MLNPCVDALPLIGGAMIDNEVRLPLVEIGSTFKLFAATVASEFWAFGVASTTSMLMTAEFERPPGPMAITTILSGPV